MFFTRRPLLPGEPDYERWLAWLLPASWLLAWLLLVPLRVRLPGCPMRMFTGIPCFGCGSTRATAALIAGHFWRAFLFNPAWTLACVAGVVAWFYALGVVFLKMPRLRDDSGKIVSGNAWRVGIVIVILANWAWVFYSHIGTLRFK